MVRRASETITCIHSDTIQTRICCSPSKIFVKAFVFAGAPDSWQRSRAVKGFEASGFPMICMHLHGAFDSA